MRRYVFGLAVCACTMLGPALAMGDDQEIARVIVERLQAEKNNGSIKGFSIDLQVEEGTVWMSGRVASPDHQARALDIARRVVGVKQVVNDLEVIDKGTSAVQPAVTREEVTQPEARQASAHEIAATPARSPQSVLPTSQGGAIGTGVAARPISTPIMAAQQPQFAPQQMRPTASNYPAHANQVPLAYSQARSVGIDPNCDPAMAGAAGVGVGGGGPVPMYAPGSGVGVAPARYDHPNLPGYAWPTYAASPNYAAVTYPKQYSPTAWPYIGPFYPYPQVPLGWRKVTLEWDDGWWQLDFKDRRHWSRKW